ncbi:MAG: hypothetical protein DI549_11920 [Ancylobacter novellus]|uniref:MxaH protein n=1 Tax=Ancylobacter novellus TaxID=921 RepID=A0A2W5SHD5_ANCNO|nr:MAG: hypothetical protein DI549_11920 [Ancylobacter novellus]
MESALPTLSLPRLSRALAGAGLALALAGCPSEAPPEPRERVAAPARDDATRSALARKTWLQPTDSDDPDVWLASRDAGHDVAPGAPGVAAWRAILTDADARFGETDRMIANRAVQLEAMLQEIRVTQSAREIIADFVPLAAKGSRSGFSDLCQHYYNLRVQGLTREAALAVLRREAPRPSDDAPPAGEGTP